MADPREDPDAADIRRVLAGDRDAFAGLVTRHARRVHDLARRMLRDDHAAEDVTQHAFLNAYRALDRFDRTRPFRHWILRIASNLCRNRYAARKARRERPPVGGDAELPDPEDVRAPRPGAATRDTSVEGVREAIEALPEAYRLAVVLHYVHGLSLEEVSEVAEIPVATVKTHLHRARAALRARLKDPETPAGEAGTKGGR
jgi:RNA polymerase sigma-70 factor (ECF subfamily)